MSLMSTDFGYETNSTPSSIFRICAGLNHAWECSGHLGSLALAYVCNTLLVYKSLSGEASVTETAWCHGESTPSYQKLRSVEP